jgi:hypothetical protein
MLKLRFNQTRHARTSLGCHAARDYYVASALAVARHVVIACDATPIPPTALDALGSLLECETVLTQRQGIAQQPQRPWCGACLHLWYGAPRSLSALQHAPGRFGTMLRHPADAVHELLAEPRAQTLHEFESTATAARRRGEGIE